MTFVRPSPKVPIVEAGNKRGKEGGTTTSTPEKDGFLSQKYIFDGKQHSTDLCFLKPGKQLGRWIVGDAGKVGRTGSEWKSSKEEITKNVIFFELHESECCANHDGQATTWTTRFVVAVNWCHYDIHCLLLFISNAKYIRVSTCNNP